MYEHAKETFEERLAAAGESFDGWKESACDAVFDLMPDGTHEALRGHILVAERRCEEALAEVKKARANLQAVMAEGAGVFARRHLRRKLREANRSACAALEQWQALGAAYLEAAAVPAG